MTFYLFMMLLGVAVMTRVGLTRLKKHIAYLENQLETQRTLLGSFERRLEKLQAPAAPPVADSPPASAPPEEVAAPPAAEVVPEPEPAPESAPEPGPEAVAEGDENAPLYGPRRAAAAARVEAARPAPKVAAPDNSFGEMEKNLSTKWMMWLGGVALALGGGFLVKYSIDSGMLSPAVRVTLATFFGLMLAGAGEMVRRKRRDVSFLAGTPDYLPAAISAGGIFTLFAAVYSAYALYGFIAPFVAFVLLAILSLGASALALVQGRFFAYLGLVCGMVAPVLVSTGDANAWALFPYLLVITGAGVAVARLVRAPDVSLSSLALAGGWVLLWALTSWEAADIVPTGFYVLALGVLNVVAGHGTGASRAGAAGFTMVHAAVADAIGTSIFALLFMLVRLDGYGAISLALFAAALMGQGWLVLRDKAHDPAGVAGVLASLLLLGVWHEGALDLGALTLSSGMGGESVMSPGAGAFLSACLVASVLVGGFVFLALGRLSRKALWAGVGAVYPAAALVLAYWRLADFDISMPFALAALGLAALSTLAVGSFRKSGADWAGSVMAAYAAVATFAVALAFAMVLRDGWLSLALAAEVMALAYIWRRLDAVFLRTFAMIVAGAVLVRLLLNPAVLFYAGASGLGVFNWMVLGYGLSAAFFVVAARMFSARAVADSLASFLNAGAVMLVVAFTTLEIRLLANGDGSLTGDFSSLEAALQTINWSVAAAALMWLEARTGNAFYRDLRKFMTGVSILAFVVAGGLLNNIFLNNAKLGPHVFWNLQLLQYLVPSLILGVQALIARRAGWQGAFQKYGVAFLLGTFAWLTLEVRHAFHPYGGQGAAGEWEWYAYSFVWLIYAVVLLFAGLRFEQQKIRQAGLAVLSLVVVKVFVFDMSNLEGVARALSFMGLGGGLIAIGYLYQKLSRQDAR